MLLQLLAMPGLLTDDEGIVKVRLAPKQICSNWSRSGYRLSSMLRSSGCIFQHPARSRKTQTGLCKSGRKARLLSDARKKMVSGAVSTFPVCAAYSSAISLSTWVQAKPTRSQVSVFSLAPEPCLSKMVRPTFSDGLFVNFMRRAGPQETAPDKAQSLRRAQERTTINSARNQTKETDLRERLPHMVCGDTQEENKIDCLSLQQTDPLPL